MGRKNGFGRLECDVWLFRRTARDGFCGPGCGWRRYNRLRIRFREGLQVKEQIQERKEMRNAETNTKTAFAFGAPDGFRNQQRPGFRRQW
jgi:hypothetical protein